MQGAVPGDGLVELAGDGDVEAKGDSIISENSPRTDLRSVHEVAFDGADNVRWADDGPVKLELGGELLEDVFLSNELENSS